MNSTLPTSVTQFVIICITCELLTFGGFLLGVGTELRNLAIVWGGFWPEFLLKEMSFFPGQSITMFFSSVFLHGGPLHLFMNMMGLVWLGPIVAQRIGNEAFWLIAGLSAIGSGIAFTLLSGFNLPMIGASGVLFGYLGTVLVWTILDLLERRESLRPLMKQSFAFLVLNVAIVVLAPVGIAWHAHLGGLLAGGIIGLITWRRITAPQEI